MKIIFFLEKEKGIVSSFGSVRMEPSDKKVIEDAWYSRDDSNKSLP
jgi:hypothetical protein